MKSKTTKSSTYTVIQGMLFGVVPLMGKSVIKKIGSIQTTKANQFQIWNWSKPHTFTVEITPISSFTMLKRIPIAPTNTALETTTPTDSPTKQQGWKNARI